MAYVDTICRRMTEFHAKLRFDETKGFHDKQQIKGLKHWWNELSYRDKVKQSFIFFTRCLFVDMSEEMEAYYELLLKNAYFFGPAVGAGDIEVFRDLKPKLITPSLELVSDVVGHEADVEKDYFKNHEVSRYWGVSMPRNNESLCKVVLPEFGAVDVAGVIYNGFAEKTWIVYRRNEEKDDFRRYGLFGDADCDNAQDAELNGHFVSIKNIVKNVIIKYDADRRSGVREEIILPPVGSDKSKKWQKSTESTDSRSLFRPTSLKGYVRAGTSATRSEEDEKLPRNRINFSQPVAVVGHWRTLKYHHSVGKGKFGDERVEKGRTWVVEHERGSGTGDVVKKVENIYI